jgi:hypothetical protein
MNELEVSPIPVSIAIIDRLSDAGQGGKSYRIRDLIHNHLALVPKLVPNHLKEKNG